jgi:hypothetical protein
MALVTITGAKYAAQSLTTAGTTTVTIGAATFVSGDFGATQRMVALFTSASVFKGIAWVRRFISTTVLELENQFVDPATGLYATQAAGDLVLVNIKSSEVTAADFVVSGIPLSVTTNDAVRFGTNGNQASVCFYEENMDFNTRGSIQVWGGVVVFGKLMSYDGTGLESLVWSRECNVKPRSDYLGGGTGSGGGNSIQYNIYATGGASAHSFFFGGMIGGTLQQTNFIGAEGIAASNATFAFFGTRMNYGCSSPGNGGNWAVNPARHLLYKTIHEARYNNANLIVWGNGAAQPAFLSFPQFGSGTPVGIFRASNAAAFGATANNRTVVADTGSGAFIDDINNGSYTFTNVITPTVNILRFAGGNVPITFQFSDDYINLQPRTTVVVQRTDGTIATSVVNTASTTFTATAVQATYSATANGAATPTNFYTAFNYGVKCYGYQVVGGTHSAVTYSLGTAGNGTNLKLGGLINQVADTGVTLTETQALALASKFSVNTSTSTVTVLVDATLSELYDYTVAWGCASAANAVIPSLTQYLFGYNGQRLTAFANWSLVINSGATLSPDSKYKELELTGTGLVTVNGAIDMPYRDADGLRVTVTGLDPEAFGITWFLRHRTTGGSTWTNVSGTGNTALILLAAGAYEVQVRAPGYDWQSALTLDTAESLSLNAGLRYQVSANNTPQYTMAFDATLEAIFQYDALAMQVSVENETGAIIQPGFAELYQATQRIQHIPDLVWTWTAPVTANATSQRILIPDGNPIRMYLTDDSDATVKITCPVIYASTGESADDRVRGNPAGFSIILGSPATAESAGLAAQIISGLGGAGYTESEASQVALKALIDEVQALVGQVKARTDLVPDEPAAVGDAMTLTAAYDAAKTAATQTSVDGVATAVTALGEPLQAADYTEPATAEAIATQVEVQIINDDDGRAVLQAIADKIMAEEISSTVIAQSVRAELAPELGRIDVAISTRSTLTAEDIPEGLTAAEVWSATTRTLTEAAGLTTEQAEQLAALPTLADIEGTTVLAKAADLADLATSDQVSGLATQASVDALAGDVPTASETAAAVLGATVETGATVVQSLRLANAVLAGKVSGGQTGVETFRDLADTKDVIVSTNDVAGNRTAVTKNLG